MGMEAAGETSAWWNTSRFKLASSGEGLQDFGLPRAGANRRRHRA